VAKFAGEHHPLTPLAVQKRGLRGQHLSLSL
jgi:hypothetical protein